MRKKRFLGWAIVIGGATTVVVFAPHADERAPIVTAAAPTSTPPTPKSDALLARLPERDALGKRRGELFPSQSWAPPPVRKPAPEEARAVPAAPSPPPMPFRVAGKVVYEGGAHVVLAKGDRVYTVREGDTLEDVYRVASISPEGIKLVYLPLGVEQSLPVNVVLLAAPKPAVDNGLAELRWEGPKQIRAGDAFSVALKVTSDQPVRSAPLQVSFDADLLQAVDVRRGGFFADGNFSYRINPSGSIFIGAMGKGEVPADAEFFVVTFKPVRAGDAELKLSSVLLQGAAGRAIAHAQPAAFRTSIIQ